MIEIRHDDLIPFLQRQADGETDRPDEGRGIHTESNFFRTPRIHESRYALPRAGNRSVDGDALRIASTALHVMIEQVAIDSVQHRLRHLRAGGIVEEDKMARALQSRKLRAQGLRRKHLGSSCCTGLHHRALAWRRVSRNYGVSLI